MLDNESLIGSDFATGQARGCRSGLASGAMLVTMHSRPASPHGAQDGAADATALPKSGGEGEHTMRRALMIIALLAAGTMAWWLWPAAPQTEPDIFARTEAEAQVLRRSLTREVISEDDLPPEGTRSLFDHLMAQADGVPWPFERLLDHLARSHPEGAAPLSLMIPFGRSLLKGQADFKLPRVLAATDFHGHNSPASLALAPRGQLFLGFTESADEIEVISYNEAAGRFEFQLVQDYSANGVPKLVYARRAVCLTCHQGGGPIFSERPWSETNAHPAIAERIRAAQPGGADHYLGLPALVPLAAPERYDALTDVGLFLPVLQTVWVAGCGLEGDACRRAMLREALRFALDPGGYDAEREAGAEQLRELQRQHWPASGIPIPNGDLRNRDPLEGHTGFFGALRSRFVAIGPRGGAETNEDLAAFAQLPKLPVPQDPLTPRPPHRVLGAQDLDGVFGLAALFTASDLQRLEQAAGGDDARLLAAVDALDADLFRAGPVARMPLMQALLATLGAPTPAYCCLDAGELSPPQLAGIPPLAITTGSVLEHYETYCFACHRGNPAARLNFMGGDSEQAVLAQIRDTDSIRDVLDYARYLGTDRAAQLMPPTDSPQRERLDAAGPEGQAALKAMRDAVPSLFGF